MLIALYRTQREQKTLHSPDSATGDIESCTLAMIHWNTRCDPRCTRSSEQRSVVGGVHSGDMVRAVVPAGSSKAGVYVGRIALRAGGSCNLKTATETSQYIRVRYCRSLNRGDGHTYQTKKARSA